MIDKFIEQLEKRAGQLKKVLGRYADIAKQEHEKAEESERFLNNWQPRLIDICKKHLEVGAEPDALEVFRERTQHELNIAMDDESSGSGISLARSSNYILLPSVLSRVSSSRR